MKPTGPFYLESESLNMKKNHDELKLLHIFVAEPMEVDSGETNGDEYETEMFFVAQDVAGDASGSRPSEILAQAAIQRLMPMCTANGLWRTIARCVQASTGIRQINSRRWRSKRGPDLGCVV